MTFSLENLQPEVFANNQTWLDFLNALAEVLQEQVREPLSQMEDIRHFVDETDPFILVETIKMLGFDIPADLIKHNIEKLSRAVYMLSMFHEISGVEGFERSIEFVLGREVIVRTKYTNNYVDFYTEPQGPLLIDGGDWYQTTHISLGMELVPGDRNLILPIGKTLQDRLLDAYFEFAPINQVVDDFFFIQKIHATIFLSGKIYINPTRRKVFGGGVNELRQIVARGPQTVFSQRSVQFFAEALFAPTPCYDTSFVYMGESTSNSNVVIGNLPQHSNDLQQYTVQNDSGYLWYVSPVELGAVTFTDTNGFVGGWDGASWGADIGDTYGPVTVQHTVGGISRQWNVYRTDFPALGNYTFGVSYSTLRDSSCDAIDPVVITPPGPINPPECTTTNVNLYPIFDVAPFGIFTGSGLSALQQSRTDTQNFTFSLNIQAGYGYLSYPVALGFATFTDSNGFVGGWDGASWLEGEIGDYFGPLVVTRDVSGNLVQYYLYRTDFPDLGIQEFTVSFQNAGQNLSVVNYDCASDTCVSGYPVVVEGVAELNTDSQIVANTVTALGSTNNLTLVVSSATYSYLCYPTEMGLATFTDSNGFVGGWDGASWLTGEVGTTYGPITITRNVEGITSNWYLYRTDFEGISETFNVVFQNPGLCVTTADPVCYVSGVPRYGSGFELHTGAHLDSLTPLNLSESSFNIVVNSGQYGYFASPAALGVVTFTDSLGFVGGWDGARWPHGTIGTETGPSLVWRNINGDLVPWYLYRTDFPALGAASFTVSYQNDLELGDSASCNINMPLASDFVTGTAPVSINFPIYGIGPIGIDNDFELSQLLNTLPSNSNQVFNLTIPAGDYGYFAHPSNLGIARFVDNTGLEGGWDGASWESTIGQYSGPIAILRNIGGVIQTWYLYRTDFPGLGVKQYTVSFGYAEEDSGYRTVRIVEPTWTTNRPDLVHFDDLGVATFGRVYVDTIIQITAEYNGSTDTISILLRPDMPDVLTMTLLGHGTVIGGQNAVYGLEGVYDDGFTRPVDGATYTVLSPYARFINNTLFTDNPPSDQVLNIQARYVNDDGVEVIATRQILLQRVLTELHVIQISITGPSTLLESTSAQYVATVLYSNGTSVVENVVWTSDAAGLYIDNTGYATATSPISNFTATLKAQYQFKGIVYEAIKSVTVVVETMTAVSMQIIGQNTIRELSTGQFSALVTWSNGTVTVASANWTSSAFNISDQGILTTGSVGGTTSLSLIARAEGLTATKIVTVYNTPVVLEHINIIGANTVNEGTASTYRVFAHYSNNTDIQISATLYVEGNPPYVTITGNVLTFTNATDSLIELVAVYNDGVRDYTARKQVVLVNTAITLVGLSIIGPSEVLESKRIALAAVALYSDGSQDIVEPVWTVRNLDTVNEPETHADIVSPGVVQGRLVQEDKNIVVSARFFTQVVDYPVIVRDYTPPGPDVPVSYRIEGPDTITVNEIGSYVLICQFENCPSEIMLSNDWALDATVDVAILDSNGFLRSINKQPATVTVTATWEYNGHAIQVTKVVQISNAVVLSNLLINGPTNMSEQSSALFYAEYFYSNETPIAGTGGVPESGTVTWSVSGSPLASITSDGLLSVGDLDASTPITVSATYTRDGIVLNASVGVLVAGALPPIVAHNLIGTNSVLEGGVLTFVVEVFRQNMLVLTGTGIVVNPATMTYSVTQGTIVNGVFTAPQVNADSVVTLTITGQYESYPFTIVHQINVFNRNAIELLFTGPSTISSGSSGAFVGEVFYTGENIVPGQGSSVGIIYSLPTAPAGVSITGNTVSVSDTVDNINFPVTATSGALTRTLNVNVPLVVPFNSIRNVSTLSTSEYQRLYTYSNQSGQLMLNPSGTHLYTFTKPISGVTQSASLSALPLSQFTNAWANRYSYNLTVNANEYTTLLDNGVFGINNSVDGTLVLRRFNANHTSLDVFATLNLFLTVAPPGAGTLSGTTALLSEATVMDTADGKELYIFAVRATLTYSGRVTYLYYLRVFECVGNTFTYVQDIFDPDGYPSTYSFGTTDNSYNSNVLVHVSGQQGGTALLATFTDFVGTTSFKRVLYRWNGTSFTAANAELPASVGYGHCAFYNVAGKEMFIARTIKLSGPSVAKKLQVCEIVNDTITLVQDIPLSFIQGSSTYDVFPRISVNMEKLNIVTQDISGSHVARVYGINPSTGALVPKLTYTHPASSTDSAGIVQPVFSPDGKVIYGIGSRVDGRLNIIKLTG
jgi:hypothetical protein